MSLVFLNNKYSSNENSVELLLVGLGNDFSPVASGILKWLLVSQPIIHPVGEMIETSIKLLDKTEPLIAALEEIDYQLMESIFKY